MKLQADAKHQQDHPDLGQLLGEFGVRDEPRRVRPDHDAGEQVADNRRQAGPMREVAEDQRRAKPSGERQDDSDVPASDVHRTLGGLNPQRFSAATPARRFA